MASFRSGPGGTGAGEAGPYFDPFQTSIPSAPRLRNSRKESGASHERSRTIPQPQMSSRLPQSFPLRRPSNDESERPYIDRKPQYRSSVGNGNPIIPSTNASISSASTSSKLPTPGLNRRNVLRRKHSGLTQEMASSRDNSRDESKRTSSSLSSSHRSQASQDASTGLHFDRNLTASPMEIRVAQQVELPKTTAQTVTIYPELDRYCDRNPPARAESPSLELPHRIATHDLPPPTPLFSGASSQISGFSGSPSTRFSGSPGPGPYSRDTTPTSMSSQSPGLVAPMRIPAPMARMKQMDPAHTRPPISRRRTGSISNDMDSVSAHTQGLAAVRESLTSSSSNSTVRDADRKEKTKTRKNRRLSPPPPSPPPRKSSQKFNKNRDEGESPSKSSRGPAQPLMTSPQKPAATSYSRPRPRPTPGTTSAPTVPNLQPVVSPKPAPPTRPSRDGTPDLQSQLGLPLPIIHSNLSTTSLSERRQSSHMALAPTHGNLPILSSSAPDRPSYLSRAPVGREATPAPGIKGGMDTSKPPSGRSTRTPSPSVSSFKTRFPLFGRKQKPAAETTASTKSEKPVRKGPAAGTGHEGYGRLGAIRRRSNSTATVGRAIPGTMSSQESLGSNQSHDSFLLERMAPVVIAGGEVVENRNTSSELCRTESNQSFSYGRPSVDSRTSSQVSLSSREGARNTLWPSPLPRPATKTPSLGSRRPSDSSDSEAPAIRSALALRRSMQRLNSEEQEAPRIPKPIVTRSHMVSPSITSADASIMSDDSLLFPPSTGSAAVGKESGGSTTTSGPKKLLKRARSPRKWNFFSRTQSGQPVSEKKKQEATANTVTATVKVVQAKPVPFYAMMDSSEQEDADTPDMEEILRRAKGDAALYNSQATDVQKRMSAITRDPAPGRLMIVEDSAPPQKLASPRNRQIAPPPVSLSRPVLSPPQPVPVPEPAPAPRPSKPVVPPQKAVGRPSRLPQVGRIPKVVSARAEQTSPKSFSRPFHRLSYQTPILTVDPRDVEFVAKGPSPPKLSTPELTQDGSTTTTGTNASAFMYTLEQQAQASDVNRPSPEFLSFSPRKNSEGTVTTSSSSSGGLLTYANATAVIPDRYTPLAEDEIWDEYNDLLGDEAMRVLPTVGPSLAKTTEHGCARTEVVRPMAPPLESPTVNSFPIQSMDQALAPEKEKEPVTSSVYSLDFGAKIKQALEANDDPVTSFYESESPESQSRNSRDGIFTIAAQQGKATTAATASSSIAQTLSHTRRPSNASSSRRHQVRQSDASCSSSLGSSIEENSPLSQVNLRVGSMTVSKWLTFGHVLFSPVREELLPAVGSSLKRHSILVIDGLGNDDWSFYAAETYPSATFFNLSPRPPLPSNNNNHRHSSSAYSFPLSPPNHHQVQYTSHADKFPFAPQSFTSVVFRFPAAAPEAHHRNVISEARRVLKPGGFIELSILDVDLNNMGNRGRRSVRRLKERIHAAAPDTSLGSTSDLMLRLLGRRGFADIKTCRVGVPVGVSGVARSSSSGGGGGGAEGMKGHARRGSKEVNTSRIGGSGSGNGGGGKGRRKDDRSLPEMINDEGPVADENITKMVAKVGRWWYSRCYENVAAAAGDGGGLRSGGLWRDRALLAECEEWGTSLKLMVCHARLPDGRARVASI